MWLGGAGATRRAEPCNEERAAVSHVIASLKTPVPTLTEVAKFHGDLAARVDLPSDVSGRVEPEPAPDASQT